MKNRCKYTMMAALAVVGAILMGCAGEDMANEAPQAKSGNKVIQTTTISLGGSAGTRALDANGKKTFAVGDQIAIFYKNTSDELQLANSAALTANDISSDGKTATITVEMTDPKPESQLRYIYPAAMAITDYDPAEEIGNTINYEKLSNDQDGTLETLASTCDLAVYDGNLTSNSELPGSATLKNLLAIAEFTFKDYSGTDITSLITKLTIMQGDNSLTINRTAAAGPIYVAMSPCSDEDISIIATDGTNSYEKTATAKSLAANTMTPVTMKMQKVVDLSKLTADYEAQDGDILTETLGTNVKISIADGAEIALRDMAINGIDNTSYQWAGITCLGDATIILKDGTTNSVKGFRNGYPGIFVPENKTLTIKGETEGTGSLNARSYAGGAGIGGGHVISCGTCGNIDIQGGKITATGGESGAGIGGGPLASCGNITISGGTIEATGQLGSGIGSGDGGDGSDPISCGNITISGGTVKATSGKRGAAGIGCGPSASCGNITISGGTIEATGQDGAGIGSSNWLDSSCGDITISGGTVKATSISNGAGIGSGVKCGNITISGGTVEATGANKSAGIGGGTKVQNTCGTITITTGVTKVTATKGEDALYSIGRGNSSGSTCGTVTIGGDATTYAAGVAESPFVYPTPSVALSAVTSADYLGWRICSDGKAYAAAGPLPSGVTAVAKIVYVGSDNGEAAPYNHGLALALSDANGGSTCQWKTSNTYAGHIRQTDSYNFTSESGLQYNATQNSDTYPAFKAAIANNGTVVPTGCPAWFLASGYQWQQMAGAVGGYNNLGLQENAYYWSSTERDSGSAWVFYSNDGTWLEGPKDNDNPLVRACLAF